MSARKLLQHPAVRFLISGGIVAVVSISLTTTLRVLGTPFQLAFVIGYGIALSVHFLLHRRFTFASEDEFALAPTHQARRFLLTAGTQYAIIAGGVAVLAPLLHVPDLAVYLTLIVILSCANFVITRHRIFHPVSAAS